MRELSYTKESHLGNYNLDDISFPVTGFDTEEDPELWNYVQARTGDRGAGLYSEGIYRVLRTKEYESLLEEGKSQEVMKEKEILEEMPKRMKEKMVMPSVSGEYLTVKEVRLTPDGEIETTSGHTKTIPVEYVIEPLSYSEAKNKLQNNY